MASANATVRHRAVLLTPCPATSSSGPRFCWTLLVCRHTLAGFVLIEVLELTGLHFTYAAFASFLVSCLLLAAVSLATGAPPEEKVGEYTWRRRYWTEETEELKEKP